jgi:hypothetical protein
MLKRSIFCAVAFAGLCLAVAPAALAQDAPPASASAPPAATAALPAPAPAPPAPPSPPPGYAPPPGYGYPPPAYGYPPPGYAYPPPGYAYPPGYGPPPGYSPQAELIPPGYHVHNGFYMRLALGGGGASASGAGEKYSGSSLVIGAAFGGAITPSLILYGEIFGHTVPGASYETGGVSSSSGGRDLDIFGGGPGVAYYFMPLNLYLSGTFLLQQVRLSDPNDSNRSVDLTKTGFGFSLMVGKEWWVSADWGVGVAAEFLVGTAKDRYFDARWTSKGLGLVFSASYN